MRLLIRNNSIVFYSILILSSILLITSLSGETLITSSYGNQQKIGTSLYEYIIPLLLISYVFSGDSAYKKKILLYFILIYIIKDLLFGGRVSSIQVGLLAFILFIDNKLSFNKILIGTFISIAFLKIFEIIRLADSLSYSTLSIDIQNYLLIGNSIKVYGSNEGDVIYSSIRLIGMINESIISFQERIYSFFLFLASMLNPGITLHPLANLTSYLQPEYPAGGGGMFPVYFFVWGGYIGVIISALIVSTIINFSNNTKNMYMLLYSIMLLVSFPRWFAYSPIITLRLCMAPLYIYVLINQFIILYNRSNFLHHKKN